MIHVAMGVLSGQERSNWVAPNLVLRLLEAATARNSEIKLEISVLSAAHRVEQARNLFCEKALNSRPDWVAMLDNDQIPPPRFIDRAMELHQRADVDVVALPSVIAANPPHLNVGQLDGDRAAFPTYLPPGWRQVTAFGTGLIFIRRCALERLERPWFRLSAEAVAKGVVGGEDLGFARRLRDAGLRAWTNTELLAGHLHTADFAAIAGMVEAERFQFFQAVKRRYPDCPGPAELLAKSGGA